mgnify:CR=1 FL=1
MENEVKNGRYVDKYGTVRWYKDGVLHRLDGPAKENSDGDKYWYLNDKLHREAGPAVEDASGYKEWWMNGVQYSKEEFNQWLEKYQLNKKLEATLEVKPSIKKAKI